MPNLRPFPYFNPDDYEIIHTSKPCTACMQTFGAPIVERKLSKKASKQKHLGYRAPKGPGGRPLEADKVRDKSGKSRGDTVESIIAVALNQPHRRDLPTIRKPNGELQDLRMAEAAENPHDRYLLTGDISKVLHRAGTRYLRDNLVYRAAIGAPDSLRRGSGKPGSDTGPDLLASVAAFEAAFAILDRDARMTLSLVLFRGQCVPFGYEVSYRRGLIRLSQHYANVDACAGKTLTS